jgi:hypothetical protein
MRAHWLLLLLLSGSAWAQTPAPAELTTKGRHELVFYPLLAQLNAESVSQLGASIGYRYHAAEGFALQLTPLFHWQRSLSAEEKDLALFTREGVSRVVLQSGATLGFELTPLRGDLSVAGKPGFLALVVSAGAGIGSAGVRSFSGACTGSECREREYDLGIRPLFQVGLGVQLFLGDRFALRLEVRDHLFSERVDELKGCTVTDADALQAGAAPANARCAQNLLTPSERQALADALRSSQQGGFGNLLSAHLGFGVLF